MDAYFVLCTHVPYMLSGCYRQVLMYIQAAYSESVYSDHIKGPRGGGLYRQVVLIQRCVSITEVAHGAAYSGHCRRGLSVLKTGFPVPCICTYIACFCLVSQLIRVFVLMCAFIRS